MDMISLHCSAFFYCLFPFLLRKDVIDQKVYEEEFFGMWAFLSPLPLIFIFDLN